MAARQKPTIFISHASEDAEIANAIESVIRDRHGDAVNVFNTSDGKTLHPGCHWKQEITTAVKDSVLMLVILTENSNQKPWIYWESGGAFHQEINVIPLLGPELSVSELQVLFPDLQTIRLLSKEGLQGLMSRIDTLCRRLQNSPFDPHALWTTLKRRFDESDLIGKDWIEAAKPKIASFLKSVPTDGSATIRIIGYTGETTAQVLSLFIAEHRKPRTQLEIEVMLRSEYSGFSSRPSDCKFNRIIRWRIARAKADWYRSVAYREELHGITVRVRDYEFDPMPKFLILGDSEGYFGQYRIDESHLLSTHPDAGRARDWVSASIDMVFIGKNQPSFIRAQTKWFKAMWALASQRTNEPHRVRRSDALWKLIVEKAEHEPFAERLRGLWSGWSSEETHLHVGNLALPARCSEAPGEIVDVIGSVLVHEPTRRNFVVAEIREDRDSWEGAGKTKAYLSLVGLDPQISKTAPGRGGDWHQALQQDLLDASISWKVSEAEFRLIASDFFWSSVEQGGLRICQPEGELAFGLWDVARFLVRREVAKIGQWSDGVHRVLERQQELILKKLPLQEFESRYDQRPGLVQPSFIFILENRDGEECDEEIADREKGKSLLFRLFRSGPCHRSSFWMRRGDERVKRDAIVDALVKCLDAELPRIIHIKGTAPFDSLSQIIRKWVHCVKSGVEPPADCPTRREMSYD